MTKMLWIAFEIFIFDRLTTARPHRCIPQRCCELLSKFLSLTDWQQRIRNYRLMLVRCELLSKFLSLTDWQQRNAFCYFGNHGCELLSKFLSLTDWQQPCNSWTLILNRCELLSKFLSLTDWQQLNMHNVLLANSLWCVVRNKKNPITRSDFLYVYNTLQILCSQLQCFKIALTACIQQELFSPFSLWTVPSSRIVCLLSTIFLPVRVVARSFWRVLYALQHFLHLGNVSCR